MRFSKARPPPLTAFSEEQSIVAVVNLCSAANGVYSHCTYTERNSARRSAGSASPSAVKRRRDKQSTDSRHCRRFGCKDAAVREFGWASASSTRGIPENGELLSDADADCWPCGAEGRVALTESCVSVFSPPPPLAASFSPGFVGGCLKTLNSRRASRATRCAPSPANKRARTVGVFVASWFSLRRRLSSVWTAAVRAFSSMYRHRPSSSFRCRGWRSWSAEAAVGSREARKSENSLLAASEFPSFSSAERRGL